MRRVTWLLLLLFAFTIPWEYSMDFGEPLGNVARIVGLCVLLAATLAVLQRGRVRAPGAMQWLVLGYFVWFCLTYFWTADPAATLEKIRGLFQETMVVWLIWEFAERPDQLRALMRATVAGCWVLALLTLANFASPEAIAAGQIRFAATGQDPNDVARYLDLGLPIAAVLLNGEERWWGRQISGWYLPVGLMAVMLTASRSGLVAASVAVVGSVMVLVRRRPARALAAVFILPLVVLAVWIIVPSGTLIRLASTLGQIHGGDLNQRWNIWIGGWQAFARAPLLGRGAGSFVAVTGGSPIDTAHNSALAILVEGGLCALAIAAAIVAKAVAEARRTTHGLRIGLGTVLATWFVLASVATVQESRTTWLMLGILSLAGRLGAENRIELEWTFAADGGGARKPLGIRLVDGMRQTL